MPQPANEIDNLVRDTQNLLTEVQFELGPKKLHRMRQLKAELISRGCTDQQLQLFMCCMSFMSEGACTVERTTVTNSNSHIDINNSGGLIAGAAIGPTASVKAGDITSTVGSGNITTESLTQAIAGARNYLSQKGDISDDDKDATVRMLDNLEREVALEKPNAGIIAGFWNTLQTVAAWAATAKPFVEIGVLLMKAGYIPGVPAATH